MASLDRLAKGILRVLFLGVIGYEVFFAKQP